nr:glycosyltransferase [Vannielia litorea]
MSEIPRVALCCDDGFLAPSLVTAHSLLRHRSGATEIWLCLDQITPHAERWVERLGAKFPQARFHLTKMNLPTGSVGPSWTLATYGRLLLRDLVGKRLIYLDGDTLVCADIGPLFRAKLRGNPVGGVRDYPCERMQAFVRRGRDPAQREPWLPTKLQRIGHLVDLDSYINTGVLVVDFENPNHAALFDKLCDVEAALAFRETHETPFVDQDWINHVMRGAITQLAPEWNSGWCNHRSGKTPMPLHRRLAYRASRNAPKILHCWGSVKPWAPDATPINPPAAGVLARYREEMALAVACMGEDLATALARRKAASAVS